MNAWLYSGDCVEVMKTWPEASIDAVVCDPPYGLNFMGKEWDSFSREIPAGVAQGPTGIDFKAGATGKAHLHGLAGHEGAAYGRWCAIWAREALRVLKPGGHMLAFGGTRTYHRLACGIEDAGFEIRDSLDWIYGNGFPKSLDPCRALEMEICELPGRHYDATVPKGDKFLLGDHLCPEVPELRARYGGRGTALKPAHEPIVLARKPLGAGVSATMVAYGTGALNIDGCRIATNVNLSGGAYSGGSRTPVVGDTRDAVAAGMYGEAGRLAPGAYKQPLGRWPANMIFDEESAALLDAQSGVRKAGHTPSARAGSAAVSGPIGHAGQVGVEELHWKPGGASSFFYVVKTSRKERDYGCEGLQELSGGEATDREDDSAGTQSPRAGAGRTGGARNGHPTVKPVTLMRYLVRMVTPPGGVVLDPFCGSGSTGMAALLEGFRFVGIEREDAYVTIAQARINAVDLMLRGNAP